MVLLDIMKGYKHMTDYGLRDMNNMRNIIDKLKCKADSISKELYKKRCCLARITSTEVYNNSVTDYFILEGQYKGLKIVIDTIESMITDSETMTIHYA